MKEIVFLLLVTFSIMSYAQVDDSIVGKWSGNLEFNDTSIPLIFNIKKSDNDQLECYLDSPSQNAFNILMDKAIFSDDKFSTYLEAAGIAFSGILQDNSIEGKFIQSNMSFDMVLQKSVEKKIYFDKP